MKRLLFSVLVPLVIFGLTPFCGAAEKVYTFKLSVETVESHHRNKGLKIFRTLLEKNSDRRIMVDYYHSSQIYKDKDIPKALKLGTLQMGVPGIWQLEGIDPNTGITALPMFYGLPENITTDLIDGKVGELINGFLEKKLDVKILGKWYRHGYLNSGTKPRSIKTLADWKGLKIRHMGGATNALRLEALGASPILVPWPDLPMAMLQGTADGFVTNYASLVSAKLWDSGVHYATVDKQFYLHFVPMMNGKFWRSLPDDLKKILLNTWEEHVDMQWAINDYQQADSEKTMKNNGMEIYRVPDEELAKWRLRVMTVQDKIVNSVGMDKELVATVKKHVEEALKK